MFFGKIAFNSFFIIILLATGAHQLQASSLGTPTLESQINPKSSVLTVSVHNVGQGNFVSLEFWNQEENKAEYIVVDCGSSSHKEEFKHINKKFEDLGLENYKVPENFEKLLLKKRTLFGEDTNNSIHIKALILTHPDADHCNGLEHLFSSKTDIIDYIICGGLPKLYHKEHQSFENWLKSFIEKATRASKVYFPVLSYEPIKSLKDIEPIKPDSYKPYKAWGEPKHTSEDYTSHPFPELAKELQAINSNFKLYFLAVNPFHQSGPGGVTRLSNVSAKEKHADESNQESLCLKIEYGTASAILTGDATGSTTSMIQANYSPSFLKTNTLLGGHHGSFTEGSNNDVWVELTWPEYVFFSNGQHHKYGHPHKETIDAVKALKSLKQDVKQHHISWTSHKRDSRQGETTTDALFLTYESGDLAAELYKDGHVKVKTQVDGNVIEETKTKEGSKEEKKEPMEQEQTQVPAPVKTQRDDSQSSASDTSSALKKQKKGEGSKEEEDND